MNNKYHDRVYLDLVEKIFEEGEFKGDRTGTGTYSIFGHQMRFDLSGMSIPLLTTKKMFTRGVIYEILWYLLGGTDTKYLNEHNVTIWDEWADEDGELGPVYGAQWRAWPVFSGGTLDYESDPPKFIPRYTSVDQIADVIHRLRTNPNDRRIIVSAWNVGQLHLMALPPCHAFFQFWANDGKLKCQLYQRSCDVGLGVPFNIVQYSILTHMIAHVVGMEAVEFIWTGGDTHIYTNHVEQLKEQLTREPYPSPTLWLNPDVTDIDDFEYKDFKVIGYDDFHPTIKMDVSV